ncbi:MAG: PLP-dependent aminotransferase family protein [Anaerolineae bacterium]|jgi:DNA-binding transcriptional MocR family regulator|nr:PLP-dependent aminotransferase family protein [Anaerolineae bacterium]MBT7324347.1 PLP-dependent aminotransferase family protein [Anaerolineae bacterium]
MPIPAYLYDKIASSITKLIEEGTYRPGDRIPSIRKMSKQQGVSVSTILQAYLVLENRGIIEARPQAGYFVRIPEFDRLPEPERSSPSADPSHVGLHQLMMIMLRDALDPNLVQLGAAMPNIEFLPTKRLNRITSRLARQSGEEAHQYEIPPGLKELRLQIAKRSLRYGCHFSPDDIIITSGGVEAIDLCLNTVCNPGDIVAIESPMYFGTLQTLEVRGLRTLEIPTHQRDGMDLDALRFAIKQNKIKAILVISNFNNPLGSCIPDEKKKELAALAATYQIPIIENDVSGELYFADKRPSTIKAYDEAGLVMLCSSFSKDISPALRVGWVAAGQYKSEIEWRKFTANAATATLPQMVIAEFLESGGYDYHLRQLRREYARNVKLLSQAVKNYFPPETRVSRPTGGFVLWVQLPGKIDALDLYKVALENDITITPGHLFSPTNQFSNFIRLNAAVWTLPIERAVEKLGEILYGMMGIERG